MSMLNDSEELQIMSDVINLNLQVWRQENENSDGDFLLFYERCSS